MRRHILAALLMMCLCLIGPPALAEPDPVAPETIDSLKRQVTNLESQVTSLRAQLEQQLAIREELKEYRSFVEQERREAREFLETLVRWGSGVVALFLGLTGFLGIKTWKDARDQIQQSTKALEKQAELQIAGVKSKSEEAIQQVAEESVGRLKSKLNALELAVSRELLYRKAFVLVVGAEADVEQMDTELCLLRGKGLTIVSAPYSVTDLNDRLQDGKVDIVIYRYHPDASGQDPAFRPTIDAIRDCGRDIPLLVYTPSVTVTGRDQEAMNGYCWSTPARGGATLVSHTYLMTHLFSGGMKA